MGEGGDGIARWLYAGLAVLLDAASWVPSSSGEIFFGRGDFSLGFGLHSPKSVSDESINWGLVCAHMHSIARTQKILMFMSYTVECRQQQHTQQAPSTKTECDYLYGWIKKRSHTQKSHPKWWTPEI